MRWTIERGPAQTQPVDLETVQNHLRLFTEGSPPSHPDDPLVEVYIKAAIAWAEGFTRREISQRDVTLSTDCLMTCYSLPVSPIRELTAEYLDSDGHWQLLDVSLDLSSDPVNVEVIDFPDDFKGGRNSVRFIAEAGYEDLPDDMLAGLLLLIGHWYENRESVVIGSIAQSVPLTTETILWPFRALDLER